MYEMCVSDAQNKERDSQINNNKIIKRSPFIFLSSNKNNTKNNTNNKKTTEQNQIQTYEIFGNYA